MSKCKILVVDDDPKLSRLVKVLLESTQRYEVLEVNRSNDALATARVYRPDGVLLDIDMPGKDGGAIACEFATDPLLRTVPVMFISSLAADVSADGDVVVTGGRWVLPKPVDPTTLVSAVGALVRSSNGNLVPLDPHLKAKFDGRRGS